MTHAQWIRRHARAAEAQGWALIDSGLHGLEVQCLANDPTFMCDEDAVSFVGAAALRREPAALAALRLVNGT